MVRIAIVACLLGSAAASWSSYLAGLHGKGFEWKKACQSLGQSPAGYGMSSGGGATTYNLKCDNNKIKVVCKGGVCSSTYEPPAVASDTPPTGKYAKKASSRAPSSCQAWSQKEAQAFLDIHNKMRCAVGVEPVEWDGDLECQAQKSQNSINAFSHSQSYSLPISAGENIATGTDPANAAWMWFTEYLQSGGNYATAGHTIGHYSSMSWKAVKKIGCAVGKSGKGVVRCQYSSGDKSNAPNMQGKYAENLTPFKGTAADFTKCGLTVAEVKSKASLFKKWGILHPSGTLASNIGLYSVTDAVMSSASSISFPLCAFIGALAMVTIGVAIRRRRNPTTIEDGKELLSIEEDQEEGLE